VDDLKKQVCVQLHTSAVNMTCSHLLLSAVLRPRAATPLLMGATAAVGDRYLLTARRSAANPPHTAAAVE